MSGIEAMRPAGSETVPVDLDDRFNAWTCVARRWRRIPKRYILLLMTFTGVFITRLTSVNLQLFISRVNAKGDEHTHSQMTVRTWKDTATSESLSMITGMIPGALAVIHFSAHKMMATSILLSSILHLVLSLTLHHSAIAIAFITFLQGLAMGPLFPACIGVWRLWAPARERTTLVAISFTGWYIGVPVSGYSSTYLCDVFGELAGFFISGISGIIWSFVWLVVVYESPSSHPTITPSELKYLEQSVSTESRGKVSVSSIPIKSMISSVPAILAFLCFSASLYTKLVVYFTLCMDYLIFDDSFSLLNEIRFHLFWLSLILCSVISDFVISRNCGSTTLVRKITNSGGLTLCGAALAITLSPVRKLKAAAALLASVFLALPVSGLTVNTLDLSPKYACLLLAVGLTVGYSSEMTLTIVFDKIMQSEQPISTWNIMNGASSALCIALAILYALGGSGKEQPWPEDGNHHAIAPPLISNPDRNVAYDLEMTWEGKPRERSSDEERCV